MYKLLHKQKREILKEGNIERRNECCFRELEEAIGKFEEWSASLRLGEKPHPKEVQTFLWLM